jgi:crotonobetainyl-CoA:carnitine CoA-transferase CaiB-like acyl-CoA transferase
MPEGGDQSLSGIRVLELCRILAGPTCGISLAEHGADVLMVTAPQLPQVPNFVRDVSHGKRSCYLDYTIPEQQEKLHELVKDADIFLEGYRPESMERHGFGPLDLVKEKEGLIYVSVDCFGPGGVYSDRAGWDQVAQAVTGIAVTEGELENAGQPKLTPVYACDFLTGFLGSYGAMLALKKRATERGSYHVHVSLCQSAMLLQREGIADDFADAPGHLDEKTFNEFAAYDDGTIYGDLKSLGPVIRMSETDTRWNRTTPELGSSDPEWL